MSQQGFNVLYRFRYLLGSLLIVACLPLLSVFLSLIGSGHVDAQSSNSSSTLASTGYDNPNLVADGFTAAWNAINQATASAATAIESTNDSVQKAAASVAKTVGQSGQAIAGAAYNSGAWAARGTGKAAEFAAHTPVYAWHGVSSVTHIGSLISPSETSKAPVPQIDPEIAAEIANSQPASGGLPVVLPTDQIPQWPIRGIVTEEFGVPHWPYQPIHTGIDISDGARRGVTPVKPFKPGRVLAVIQSSSGFGNHVIIDHGGGLLSLYGHMDSTTVQVGQAVDENTTLGLEGTTGLSTGVHVHFEIDLNGQPVNPHQYVTGQPEP